jgi:hypothetical protein
VRDGGCARLELRDREGDTGKQEESAGHQDELPVLERLANATGGPSDHDGWNAGERAKLGEHRAGHRTGVCRRLDPNGE